MQKKYTISSLSDLETIPLTLEIGDRIFLVGDLGSGKTTFTRTLIRRASENPDIIVRSPTYTYYQSYDIKNPNTKLHHFDLYRLENPDDFDLIGGTELLEDKDNICIIEWPEILRDDFLPTKKITIEYDPKKNIRLFTVDEYSK